jgi:hypothetical protein
MSRFRVVLECEAQMWAYLDIEAATEDEAQEKALRMRPQDIEWYLDEIMSNTRRIATVEPAAGTAVTDAASTPKDLKGEV